MKNRLQDKSKVINVLHIDGGKLWRGGQRQIYFLIREIIGNPQSNICCTLASPSGPLSDKVRGLGVPHTDIPLRNSVDIKSLLRLYWLIIKNNILIAHCHCAQSHALMFLLKPFFPDLRVIVTRRVDFPAKKNLYHKMKYQSSNIDSYVAISHRIGDILREVGVGKEKICIIPSASTVNQQDKPTARQTLIQELNLPPGAFLIGNIAHLADHKGHQYLIRSAKILCQKTNNSYFIIAGTGELEQPMRMLIDELALQKRVIMLGFRDDIKYLHAAFDVFCISSHLEGLCSSIIDAFFSHTPVVATNAGGIPDLIKHNITGLLAETKNPESIAQYLLSLHQNPAQGAALAAQAFQYAEKNLSVPSMTTAYTKLYQSLISKAT